MFKVKYQIVTTYGAMELREAVSEYFDHYPTDEEIKNERSKLKLQNFDIWHSRVNKLYFD